MSFPPQPDSTVQAAANKVLRSAWLMASVLEEEEEDAGADRRHLQQQGHVSGRFDWGRAARVLCVDRLLDVLRRAADPAQPGAEEEDEALLRAELQPQRCGEAVLRDVGEQDLR